MDYILPFFTAAADRIRGGWLNDRGIDIPWKGETLLHAWTVALCFGHGFDVAGLWLVVSITLGESFGWGHPLGWALSGVETGNREAYEIGSIGDNPWLSLAVRGLLWALPAAPVAWLYDPNIWHLTWIMPLTMIGAPWIAVQTKHMSRLWLTDLWSAQEVYRGFLTGMLVVMVA